MNRNILFAKIGWGGGYMGEDLIGNFREPNKSNSWGEMFNFTVGPGNRCYGYVPPIGRHWSPPKPPEKTNFLVILCSKPSDREALRPVGWYEDATFRDGYTDRPIFPKLKRSLQPMWKEMPYCFSTTAANAYLIPTENRALFTEVPTDRFTRSYIYARRLGADEDPALVSIAEEILAMKRYARTPETSSHIIALRKAIEDATDAMEIEDGITSEEARRRVASILERPHQSQFRDRLMRTYRSRCAISECNCPDVLEAAHIVAVSEGGGDQIANGILLRADIHRLFDLKKLSIHPTKRTVVISAELKGTTYEQYEGKLIRTPSRRAHAPGANFLQIHFDSSEL